MPEICTVKENVKCVVDNAKSGVTSRSRTSDTLKSVLFHTLYWLHTCINSITLLRGGQKILNHDISTLWLHRSAIFEYAACVTIIIFSWKNILHLSTLAESKK
jgi:hypothetical protein